MESLSKHINDVDDWMRTHRSQVPLLAELYRDPVAYRQHVLLLAYERWVNDRVLLSKEPRESID